MSSGRASSQGYMYGNRLKTRLDRNKTRRRSMKGLGRQDSLKSARLLQVPRQGRKLHALKHSTDQGKTAPSICRTSSRSTHLTTPETRNPKAFFQLSI